MISPDTLRLAKLAVVLFKAKNKRLEIADILGVNPNRIPRLLEIGGVKRATKQPQSLKKIRYDSTMKGKPMSAKETPAILAKATSSMMPLHDAIHNAGITLTNSCHGASQRSGWWNDIHTGEPIINRPHVIGEKLMLVVSEIAEAMEGHRKQLMDDKLPHRLMVEVELADAVIRIFDLSGAMGLALGEAIAEKLAYNATRADHKVENRKLDGGKKY